jgi:hypothetical protein
MAGERLLHIPVHAFDGYRGLWLVSSFVGAAGAFHGNSWLVPGDAFDA